MTDFRRFPKSETRQLIDYNRFVSLTGEKLFICLDRGVIEIARYLLNSRGLWRTTYVKDYVGTIGYNMPTLEEFQLVEQAIAESNEDMSSCDDIVEALNGIAAAVSSAPAGGSSSGCGCVGEGGSDVEDVNDIEDAEVPSGESFPPGFTDREEYEDYLCKAVYFIIRNYIQTLRNWAGLFGTVGGLTLAVITGLLLLTVPPAGLMLILAAMGVMVGVDIGLLATLNEIADGIEEDIDTIACGMFNAAGTEEAAEVLRGAASTVIDEISPAIPDTFKQITDNLIANVQTEAMIVRSATIDELPEEDCSACAEELAFLTTFGTCTPTLQSGSLSGTAVVRSCVTSAFGTDRALMTVQSTVEDLERSWSGWALIEGPDSPWVFSYVDEDGDPIILSIDDLTEIPDPLIAESWQIVRGVPSDTDNFDLQFTVSEV